MAKNNILSKLGISKNEYTKANIDPAKQISPADSYLYGAGSTTISTMLGTGRREAKARQQVYEKWSTMESDAICSSALKLLVTTALGGDKTTGQMIFIERNDKFQDDKKLMSIADEISEIYKRLEHRPIWSA